MFNLFNKSKVRAGKQTVSGQKPAAGQPAGAKKQAPFAALGKTWAKLNKMDRKQAYTWGSIAVVVLLALITFASAMGGNEEDFSGFETRGYDLANMPFSSDEAEQYLLATKYPDMQNSTLPPGLYSSAEKEARQEEDAQAAAEEQQSWAAEEDSSANYVPGRYYGGGTGGGGRGTPTQVGTLNSASLKTAGGSGVSGTFGPTGDFSNFRSQEKGSDVFVPQQSTGDARKALFTSAMGSRAAAGQLDNRLANAKKAMLGNVQGSAAFMNDSGAVDLSKAAGLNLDPNAPVSSADPNAFNDALDAAHDDAGQDAADQDQAEWWQTMLQDLAKQAAQAVLSWGLNKSTEAIDGAQAKRTGEQLEMSKIVQEENAKGLQLKSDIGGDVFQDYLANGKASKMNYDPVTGETTTSVYENINGDMIETRTVTSATGGTTTTTNNISEQYAKYMTVTHGKMSSETIEGIAMCGSKCAPQLTDRVKIEGTVVYNNTKNPPEVIGNMVKGKFVQKEGADIPGLSRWNSGKVNDIRNDNIKRDYSSRLEQAGLNYRETTMSNNNNTLKEGDLRYVNGKFEEWNGSTWVNAEE